VQSTIIEEDQVTHPKPNSLHPTAPEKMETVFFFVFGTRVRTVSFLKCVTKVRDVSGHADVVSKE
jgi:hypothetical protein